MFSPIRIPIADPSARGPLQVVACVLLALVAWSGSIFRSGFSGGDRELALANPIVNGSLPWASVIVRDVGETGGDDAQLRPVTALSLRVDHALWGERATGWHATNVALHAACVALLGIALLLLGPTHADRPLPWLGLALFAVHPVLADSVAWIGGRSSMLCALAGLCGAVAVRGIGVPWRPPNSRSCVRAAICAAVALFAALASDASGLLFAPVLALLGLRHSRPMFVATSIGLLAAIAAWFGLGSAFDASTLVSSSLGERLLVGGRSTLEALRLLVAPIAYPPSYARSSLFDVDAAGASLPALASLGWLAWIALLGVGAWSVRRRANSIAAWSLLLTMLALVPVLQLSPSSVAFSPHMLYVPLLCAVPLIDACLHAVFARSATRTVLGGLAAVALCIACWKRSAVYADRGTYQRAILAAEPDDTAARLELADFLEESGQIDAARKQIELAIALAPRNALGHIGLGRVLSSRGDAAAAANEFGIATHLAPNSVDAWRGLARARLEHGDHEAAAEALVRALALDPNDATTRALATRIRDTQPAR